MVPGNNFQDVDFDGLFFHSLSGDATIMIVSNCPIIGEHVVIVFVTQKVIIATV